MEAGQVAERRVLVLEAITDSTLMELDLDKLLAVLLWRVRELFEADTVTVLLVDASGDQLVARATVGLEAEVFQGVHVPIGAGFAGRVAHERRPVRIERVDESTVTNPLLWEHGLRVMAGAPIVAHGDVLGVLHVGRTTSRPFTDEDVELLQLVADRLAMDVHAHHARAERAATVMLQESLLPSRLPSTGDWLFAARYVPSPQSGVGGDWYDVFRLPGDRLGVVIGDVVGNGLRAAIVMGRLRSALRAYALEFDDPGEVLGKLDRKASYFENRTMATVAYAVIDTVTHRMELSLAGHLPPVVAMPDAPPAFLTAPVGPPVGYDLAVTGRLTATFDVPPGALLAFYTDGLIERRNVDLDAQLERLREHVFAGDPEKVCSRIMAALIGSEPPGDDVALVTVRHLPSHGRPG
ncbi:SpoIIE family protein phosphatase [Actinophytocola sp. S1-96]|uniref:SpoIIE family protein phosphatase n=2 Tax=Actinophytocola gossypii TaxID=2812003 RepID=A0ABT2J235_9PSEU|nr:SpoIIE family protein phosphatase [Actinophytocola gossypii]